MGEGVSDRLPEPAMAAWRLSRHLRAARTATEALLAWCEERGLGHGPILAERARLPPPVVPDAQGLAELAPARGEPMQHRRVELRRGGLALVQADNWFVPTRLPPALQHQLASTDLPFGTVVAPLSPSRRTYFVAGSGEASLPAGFVLEHRAVVLDAAARPLAVVRELYRATLVGA